MLDNSNDEITVRRGTVHDDDGYEFGLILSEDDDKGGWTTTWDIEVPLGFGFPGKIVDRWIREHLNLPANVEEARDDPRCHVSDVIRPIARIYNVGIAHYDSQDGEMVIDINPEATR